MRHVDRERRVLEKKKQDGRGQEPGWRGQAVGGVRQKIETYYYRRVFLWSL